MNPQDVILARAACSWLQEGRWQTGALSLSGQRLTFWQSEGGVVLQIPLFSITAAVLTPIKNRLMIQCNVNNHWFSGTEVVGVYQRLEALREGDTDRFEPEEVVTLSGPIRSHMGLLPVLGQLLLTDRRIRFTATGMLGALLRWLGLDPDWEQPIAEGLGTHTLRGALVRLLDIRLAVLRGEHPEILGAWPIQGGAMVLIPDWLCLRRSSEVRVPLSAISHLTARADRLTIHQHSSEPITVRIDHPAAAQRRIGLVLAGLSDPHPGATMFSTWEQSEEPDRVQPWPTSPQAQERLFSGTRSTRLWFSPGDVLEIIPGLALPGPDSVGIAIPEHSGLPEVGSAISVELGQPDGVHRFDTTILRIEPLPDHIQVPRRGRLLVLRPPEEVRYTNRRCAFRVPLHLGVSAWRLRADPERQTWVPAGGRITGELMDLSSTGCSLQTERAMEIGTRMFLELRIDEHWIPLEAECVRTGPGWPADHTRNGLRFVNVPERLGRLLSRTVMAKQRSG